MPLLVPVLQARPRGLITALHRSHACFTGTSGLPSRRSGFDCRWGRRSSSLLDRVGSSRLQRFDVEAALVPPSGATPALSVGRRLPGKASAESAVSSRQVGGERALPPHATPRGVGICVAEAAVGLRLAPAHHSWSCPIWQRSAPLGAPFRPDGVQGLGSRPRPTLTLSTLAIMLGRGYALPLHILAACGNAAQRHGSPARIAQWRGAHRRAFKGEIAHGSVRDSHR